MRSRGKGDKSGVPASKPFKNNWQTCFGRDSQDLGAPAPPAAGKTKRSMDDRKSPVLHKKISDYQFTQDNNERSPAKKEF